MRLAPPQPVSENDHQKLCVEYAVSIGLRPYLIAIPNGTQLPGGVATRAKYMNHLKAMGLKPGASDLFLAKPVQKTYPKDTVPHWHHGAWFEMKRVKDGRVSAAQLNFLKTMDDVGYYVDICWGFDDWRESLHAYLDGKPTPWRRDEP
jgi:hypothetical protein